MRLVGQNIKHYRILEKLSEGGMGIVYKVLDTQLEAVRAIKVIKPSLASDEVFMERFSREAKSLAHLNHPNILTVHAFHEPPPLPFIVMEYVEGPSLGVLLKRKGSLDYKQALPFFLQVLEGLTYAHRKGVIHGDIKPDNLLINDEGRVKIADFGLARRQNEQEMTLSTMPIGTLHYMSPEHVRSMAEVDHRSDIYAVGMALYETLTGQTPFGGEDTAYIIMRAIVEDEFQPPTAFAPNIPGMLSKIVMKALAKDPRDRFQSAEVMLRVLKAQKPNGTTVLLPQAEQGQRTPVAKNGQTRQNGEPKAKPASPPPASPRESRSWATYVLLGVALLVTIGVGWWALRDIVSTEGQGLSEITVNSTEAVTIQPGIYERALSSVGGERNGRGVLLLKVMPYGSISVSGSILGEDSLEVAVPPGRRRVFFNHPTYGLRQLSLEVRAGQRKEVICYYEGLLRVEASDEDGLPLQAELYVNEQGTGVRTPIETHYSLPPGAYTVEVFKEGFLGGKTTVDVQAVSDDDNLVEIPPIVPLEFVLQRLDN